jgi:hypothetical protein
MREEADEFDTLGHHTRFLAIRSRPGGIVSSTPEYRMNPPAWGCG